MEREESDNLKHYALQVINTVTQRRKAELFELVAHEKMTFNNLLNRIEMSKSTLSADILRLSKLGLIVSKPSRREPTYYELTSFGQRIHGYLHFCESLLLHAPAKIKRITLDAEGFMKLFQKYDVESIKAQLEGKDIILPMRSYVKIVDWLDENIAAGEDTEKFEEIENTLYDEELVKVVESYQNLEAALDIEAYMRRQKKLTPEHSELVAVAEDVDAVVVSPNDKVLNAAIHVGRQAFDLDGLLTYIEKQMSYRIASALLETEISNPIPSYASRDDSMVFGTERPARAQNETSSAIGYKTRIEGGRYQITLPV